MENKNESVKVQTKNITLILTKKIFKIIAFVMFVFTSLLIIPTISSGNIFSIFFVIVFIVLIKNYKQNKKDNKIWFGWKWIIFLIILSIVGFGSVIIPKALDFSKQNTKTRYINEIVETIKTHISFPNKIDEFTELNNITANKNSIRYDYILSNNDLNILNNEQFKNSIKEYVCKNEIIKELLKNDIDIESSYFIKNTEQSYTITFTKLDCIE